MFVVSQDNVTVSNEFGRRQRLVKIFKRAEKKKKKNDTTTKLLVRT